MHSVFSLLCAVAILTVVNGSDDKTTKQTCTSLDKSVEEKLLTPLKKKMDNAHESVKTLPKASVQLFGYSVVIDGGKFGNLNSFELYKQYGMDSSDMCTGPKGNNLLLNLTFPALKLSYGTIAIHLPLVDFDTKAASLTVKGANIQVNMAVTKSADGKKCSGVSFQNYVLEDDVSLELEIDNGLATQTFAMIFNYTFKYFKWVFKYLGVNQFVNDQINSYLKSLIPNHQPLICSFVMQ